MTPDTAATLCWMIGAMAVVCVGIVVADMLGDVPGFRWLKGWLS